MADSRRIAGEVLAGIPGRAEISFAYGQGSAFTEFADAADIDVVVVWLRAPTQRSEAVERFARAILAAG
jgi:accessory colonization factor AcfC